MVKTNTNLSYVKGQTTVATRQYLDEVRAKIRLDITYVQHHLRKFDVAIMEQAQTMALTTIQMERINCVRMYLGVEYISEICNTSGDGFVVGIMTGQTRNLEYKTTTTKPYQIKPNTRSWTF